MSKKYFNQITKVLFITILIFIGFINNSYSQYFRSWVLRYQYPEFNSEPYSFTKDNGGNVFLTGKLRPDDLNSLNYSTISLGMNKCADMIFENNFNQTNDIDYGKDIAFDNNNNLYILGFYWGGSVNKGEFFLRKFTNYLTQWNYPGIHDWKDCEPYRVAVDNNGNAYVSLWSYVINPEYDDFALIKLTNSGELSWLRTYKDNSYEQTEDMAMDNSGNIIIVGGSGTNIENLDIKVIKYDSDGNLLFDVSYQGNTGTSEGPYSVTTDEFNNIYLTGTIMLTDILPNESSGPRQYCNTMKISPSGNICWVKNFLPANYFMAAGKKIKQINNNYLTVAGWAQRQDQINTTRDYLVIRYDINTGNIIWSKLFDYANSYDEANDLDLDANGNTYVTGFVYNTISYNPNCSDYGTLKYDVNGNLVWSDFYNYWQNMEDKAIGIKCINNSIYVTGSSKRYHGTYDVPEITTIRYSTEWISDCFDEKSKLGNDKPLNAIAFNNSIFIVGDSGTVLNSTDNGLNWNNIHIDNKSNLKDVAFLNDRSGIIVTEKSKILVSSNNGLDWKEKEISNENLNKIDAINNTIRIAGEKGLILKSLDVGKTWINESINSNYNIINIKYINTNEGFLLTKNGELLKTEDAGKNWNIKLTSEQNELFDIDFSDTSLGMIVGEKGKIYRTTNKGASWELIHCDNISNLNKIYFTKSNDIYIAGDNGLVLYSSNKGNNWFKIETNSNENISSIKFLNKDFGVAIGKNGKIFISSIGEKVFEAHPVLNPKSDIGNNTSNKFDLMNYPNPFNPTTKISFNLPMNSYVRLAVYNIIGQEVKVLINGRMTSGYKEIQFDGSSLSSGVYFYRLYVRDENNNNYSVTNKFLLIK